MRLSGGRGLGINEVEWPKKAVIVQIFEA